MLLCRAPPTFSGLEEEGKSLSKNLPGIKPLCEAKKGITVAVLPTNQGFGNNLSVNHGKKLRLVNVGERRKPMLKTPCRGAASTCLSWESRYPWGTVSLCQRHAAQDLPKSVLSFLVLFVCCTPVPALIGDNHDRSARGCRVGSPTL